MEWTDNPNVRPEVANAVNWGRKMERERIIALLESEEAWRAIAGEGLVNAGLLNLIALIKGDDK